jgi:uncharacterized protein
LNVRALFYTAAGALRAFWRLLLFVVACTFAGLLLSALAMPFTADTGLASDTVESIIEVVAALVATWLLLRRVDRRPWSSVGLDKPAADTGRIIVGFVIGGAAIALPILLLIAAGWLRYRPVLLHPAGHPLIAATVLLIPAAFAEELITRGYVLTVLRDAFNWPAAVIVTSVAFGLLHLGNTGVNARSVALVMLAGVFLATIRIVTKSLYAAWAAHFAWNWVMAIGFHAAVSGLTFDAPAYRYVDAGPDWATGGMWGPEGGIPAGLSMLGGTGLMLAARRRRRNGESIDG